LHILSILNHIHSYGIKYSHARISTIQSARGNILLHTGDVQPQAALRVKIKQRASGDCIEGRSITSFKLLRIFDKNLMDVSREG